MDALKILQRPYVFAVASPVLAAVLAYTYLRTTRMTETDIRKFVCKLVLFVLLANVALAYISDQPEPILQQPFFEG